jgi:hypothetical protein
VAFFLGLRTMFQQEHAIEKGDIDVLAKRVKNLRGPGIDGITDTTPGPGLPYNLER